MRISDWSSDVCSSDLAAGEAVASDRARAVDGQQRRRGGVGRAGVDRARGGQVALTLIEASVDQVDGLAPDVGRSEEHTSELQSLMRISYAVFCLKKKNNTLLQLPTTQHNTSAR